MALKKGTCIFLCLLLWMGTVRVQAASFEGHHLATGIDVVYRLEQRQVKRSFRQTGHMEAILNYLRLLEYDGIPKTDPEQLQGDMYRITVHLADGNRHVYHLHADRYLSRDFRPWVKVESDRSFAALLSALPEER